MTRMFRIALAAGVLASPALSAVARQPPDQQAAPAQDSKGSPNDQTPNAASPPPATLPATDPNLQVATVRLEGGYRASKVIGAAVYNGQNQQIGTVDDLILNHQNQADLIVISVGGFLGVGGKLVALPYGKVERADNGHVLLADGSKEALQKLPNFTYAQ